MHTKIEKMLMEVGFTQLESSVYLYLLREGPNTGYAIAKGVDKAVANVYKAIDRLTQKGGIEQTSGSGKQCVAVPWKRLLDGESEKFNNNISALSSLLEKLPEPQDDEQIYQVKSADQLRQHSVQMVDGAKHIILASLEPNVLHWLREPLIQAAHRGVEVRVKLYEAADLPGVQTIVRQYGAEVYGKTEDVQLSICVDGREMLNALLNLDTSHVVQAFRTKSALMTLMAYNQLLYEFVLTELKVAIPAGDIQKAKKILTDTEHLHVFSSENEVFDVFKDRYEISRIRKKQS